MHIERWLRHTLGSFLRRYEEAAHLPSFVEIEMREDRRDRRYLKFTLSDGDYNAYIPPNVLEDYRNSRVNLSDAFERIYSELVEDWYVNRQRLVMRRHLIELTRLGASPDVLDEAQRCVRDFEDHARRYHRGEVDSFPITNRVGWRFPTAEETITFSELTMLPPPPEIGRLHDELNRAYREVNDALMREAFFGGSDGAATTNAGGAGGAGGNSNAGGGGALTPESLREAYEVIVGRGGAGGVAGGFDSITERYWRFPEGVRTIPVELFGGGGGYELGTPEAKAKGMELLREELTPAQRQQYKQMSYFEVIGSDTGTRYRIRHGRQMNIDVLDRNGNRTHGICFLPRGNLVAGDCMVAQKLALEHMESEALRIAHRFP